MSIVFASTTLEPRGTISEQCWCWWYTENRTRVRLNVGLPLLSIYISSSLLLCFPLLRMPIPTCTPTSCNSFHPRSSSVVPELRCHPATRICTAGFSHFTRARIEIEPRSSPASTRVKRGGSPVDLHVDRGALHSGKGELGAVRRRAKARFIDR